MGAYEVSSMTRAMAPAMRHHDAVPVAICLRPAGVSL